MAASTSKKVVIHRFDREPVPGFVNPQTWLGAEGFEVLTPSGAVTTIPYSDSKVVCFVKDFEADGWRAEKRKFTSRPKSEGLWVKAVFRDNDYVEGILANDLLHGEAWGFMVAPPDASSNNQRLFLPRAALREFRILSVVGGGAYARRSEADAGQQIPLFEK